MGLTVSEKVELGVGLSVDSYYISLNENECDNGKSDKKRWFSSTPPSLRISIEALIQA